MKKILLLSVASLFLVGCTEKSKIALSVFRDKTETKMMQIAGEGECALELYRDQYGQFKERLVRLKTLYAVYQDELDKAYAKSDERRIGHYTKLQADLNVKIPEAEKSLKEFYLVYEQQREELRFLKEEISSYKANASLINTTDTVMECEKRADIIKTLIGDLKIKAKRAQSAFEVNNFEDKEVLK
jgi:hypothetical protein